MPFKLVLSFFLVVTPCFAQQPDSIRQFDFKNFNFPFGDDWDLAVPGDWEWLQSIPLNTVQVQNGVHAFPGGAYLSIGAIAYGDLDGDGNEEAAIDARYGSGGTANWHYLYVYRTRGRAPELIAILQSGSRGSGGLYGAVIQSNRLILDFADAERTAGACCSNGIVRVTYRFESASFIESAQRERRSVRTFLYGPQTRISADGMVTASIKQEKEVWIGNTGGSDDRRIFTCPSTCRNPEFSPDRRFVYFVIDVSNESGGVWRIDLSTETAAEFIPNSANFRVIQQGPYPGFVIADQLTTTRADGSTPPYPYYAFFIFRPTGARIGRIDEEAGDLDLLLREYSQ